MLDLYVYYKVSDADAARLAPLVRTMQASLSACTGARLLRRPGSPDGLQTWMEVYPAVSERFAAELDLAVARAGLAPLLAGSRHAEVFVELAPCA
jgi:hypothetical protein